MSSIPPDVGKHLSLSQILEGPKRHFSPLYAFVVFFGVAIIGALVTATQTSGYAQAASLAFAFGFTAIIGLGVLLVVWSRPNHLYAPSEYGQPTSAADLAAALQQRNRPAPERVETTQVVAIQTQTTEEPFSDNREDQQSEILELPSGETQGEPTWEQRLVVEMSSATMDFEKAEEAFIHVQQEDQDESNRLTTELVYVFSRFRNGDTDALQRLENLAAKSNDASNGAALAYWYLGQAYQVAGSHSRAETAYRTAATLATDESQRARARSFVALTLDRQGRPEDALQAFHQAIEETPAGEARAVVYEQLAHLHHERGNIELKALAYDKAAENSPANLSLRFEAARAYSEVNLDALSFWHYKVILQMSPQYAGALNNLGVQCDTLDMPILAIDAYKKAFELGNTLAAANMAHLFLKSGFTAEASHLLQEASKQKRPHANVAAATARISLQREEEQETEQAATKRGREQRPFFSGYADALFSADTQSELFAGTWLSEEGHVVSTALQESLLVGIWTADNLNFQLRGQVQGRSAKITGIDGKSTVSSFLDKTLANRGYAYVAADGQLLVAMGLSGDDITYFRWQRTTSP